MSLCFSPVGSGLWSRARRFPALVNCTTIDWPGNPTSLPIFYRGGRGGGLVGGGGGVAFRRVSEEFGGGVTWGIWSLGIGLGLQNSLEVTKRGNAGDESHNCFTSQTLSQFRSVLVFPKVKGACLGGSPNTISCSFIWLVPTICFLFFLHHWNETTRDTLSGFHAPFPC